MATDKFGRALLEAELYETAFFYNPKFQFLDARTGAVVPGPKQGEDGRFPAFGVSVTDELFTYAVAFFRAKPWVNACNDGNKPWCTTIHAPYDSPWIDPIPLEVESD